MEDVLIPKERRDAVVFVGVDAAEHVEFIKVYGVSEEVAKSALEEFFSAKGLFPEDYRLVSRGFEPLEGKKAITTRSEARLAAALSRLGLKLISNGVLYTDGDGVYQFTLVSDSLYERLVPKREPELKVDPLKILSIGVDAVVENLAGVDLMEFVPEGTVVLHEPPLSEAAELLASERNYKVVVDTKDASKYASLDFQAVLKLPPMERGEFARRLSELLGVEVSPELVAKLPETRLNERNLRGIADLARKLSSELDTSLEDALELAVRLNLGAL